jgi:hypothetical protein
VQSELRPNGSDRSTQELRSWVSVGRRGSDMHIKLTVERRFSALRTPG